MFTRLAAALLAAVLFPCGLTKAETYPSKPIRFVLPFGPGAASDALARITGQDLARRLGQPIVIVNKPGADGALAAIEVMRSPPDGYTFLFGTNSPLGVIPHIRKQPPYDVLKDFTPVTYMGDNSFFIVVHPSVPANTLGELIAYAKANPKKLNYATGNTYAIIGTAMFANRAGIEMVHVPYKSEPEAVVDLLAGTVHLINSTSTTVAQHVRAGKLRALATMLPERSPVLPDVPSIIEAGMQTFPIGAWFALVGPAGLPPDIVARMNKEMAATLADPNVKEQMGKQGFTPKSSTPEELAKFLKDQVGVWSEAIKLAGITAQ
jgi:tripartite-type tricarboxylate transporter receptor subunit TctC